MNFVVIDVETANHDLSSIRQVGIASFNDGLLRNSWESLVNPQDEFDPLCVSIHGIDAEKVRSSPSWAAVYSKVNSRLQGNIVAGQERSSKHRKAEALINQGQKIRIISESDFQRIAERRLVRLSDLS